MKSVLQDRTILRTSKDKKMMHLSFFMWRSDGRNQKKK